jgi:hypothetical protein
MTINLVSFSCLNILSYILTLVFSDGLLRNLKETRTGIPMVGNSAMYMTLISFILEIRMDWNEQCSFTGT